MDTNSSRLSPHLELFLFLLALTAYFTWFAGPLIPSAAGDLRLVSVFNSDEAGHLRRLYDAVQAGTLQLRFDRYGHLAFNLALLPLTVVHFFRPVSQQDVLVALRLVSTICGAGAVALTFVMGRRYFNRGIAWMAAVALAVMPLTFLEMSITSHPDTPQLLFLMLALYCCGRLLDEGGWKWLSGAAACAGLVFACKYLGLFLVPFIWSIVVVQAVQRARTGSTSFSPPHAVLRRVRAMVLTAGLLLPVLALLLTPEMVGASLSADGTLSTESMHNLDTVRGVAALAGGMLLLLAALAPIWWFLRGHPGAAAALGEAAKKMAATLAIMIIVFTVVSPYSWTHFDFVFGILAEAAHTSSGHLFVTQVDRWTWLTMLVSPEVLGGPLAVLMLAGLAVAFWTPLRRGFSRPASVPFLLACWSVFYLVFLVVRIKLQVPRYFLPVLPVLFLLAAFALDKLGRIAQRTWRPGWRQVWLPGALMTVVLAVTLPAAMGQLLEFRRVHLEREKTSVRVQAGIWLAESYPPATPILYDAYSYVPPLFTDVHKTWGGTVDLLQEVRPEVVIINRIIGRRFADPARAEHYLRGAATFMDKHDYYELFRAGRSGFTLVRDFGDVQIYQRPSPAAPD